jgi:hypothetical protein
MKNLVVAINDGEPLLKGKVLFQKQGHVFAVAVEHDPFARVQKF